MGNYKKSIFIFRRDLRLHDNTALLAALQNSETVLPCFILDPRQLTHHPYQSDHALQFMRESLVDLDSQLRSVGSSLYCFTGEPEKVVDHLLKKESAEAVFINRDYTPFSRKRDQTIASVCQKHRRTFLSYDDALLNPPEHIHKDDGGFYSVFTAFFKKALTIPVAEPRKNTYRNYHHGTVAGSIPLTPDLIPGPFTNQLFVTGGRAIALKLLKNIPNLKNYKITRNLPALRGTTGLSAHHKFGTVSIREVFHTVMRAFGPGHPLINELYWRDFFTHVAFHCPQVFGHCFQRQYDALHWDNDPKLFTAWCEGRTGFPIVDAGMRELKTTGFMHNRVRMIVASFLVKDLLIDWRWGEKYFAQQLLDYDPCVNNGNWQWAASTGCDAQPYFRIFNPWLQQQKFDPECRYIKRWVPELAPFSAKEIHLLHDFSLPKIARKAAPASPVRLGSPSARRAGGLTSSISLEEKRSIEKEASRTAYYDPPIVDHGQQRMKALAMYKSVQ